MSRARFDRLACLTGSLAKYVNVLHKRAGHTSEPVKILDTLSLTTNYTTNIEDIETNKLHYYLHTLTVCLLEPHLLHLSGTLLGALLSG